MNMSRRALSTVALISTAAVSFALSATADAAKKPVKKTRTVTLKYTGGCTIDLGTPLVNAAASPAACTSAGAASFPDVAAYKGEKYVTVTVADASGRPVPGELWFKGSSVGNDTQVAFCGSLKNYKLDLGGDFTMDLDAVGAVVSCPGTATQGTVKIVYSNLP